MVSRGRLLSVAAGFVLITAPLWGPALSLGGPVVEYRAVELTTTNGTLGVDARQPPVLGPDPPIDCLGQVRVPRRCALDAGVNGSRSVDYPALGRGSGEPPVVADRYVAFGFGSQVYRRTADYGPEGGLRLGLERVAPETALREVAVDPGTAPPVVGRAARQGSAISGEPRAGSYVVARPDREAADPTFHLVYRASRERGFGPSSTDAAVLETLSVLAGGWLLLGLRPPLASAG